MTAILDRSQDSLLLLDRTGLSELADGRPCWWDVRFAPIYDAVERPGKVLVTISDVTGYVTRLGSNRRRCEEADREVNFADDIAS